MQVTREVMENIQKADKEGRVVGLTPKLPFRAV